MFYRRVVGVLSRPATTREFRSLRRFTLTVTAAPTATSSPYSRHAASSNCPSMNHWWRSQCPRRVHQGKVSHSITLSDIDKDDLWHDSLDRAQKMVGPVKTLAGMRNLLGDELDNIGVYAQRLLDSGHPLLKKTRVFISAMDDGQQMRGLMILLLSQSLQTVAVNKQVVLKQRSLAEVNELIYTALLLHETVVELSTLPYSQAPESVQTGVTFGNKMAILGGDFLLASACSILSRLYVPKVVELMSLAIENAVEGLSSRTNESLLGATSDNHYLSREFWMESAVLSSGVVMSNSCRSTVVLGNFPSALADAASEFGSHFGLAYQTKAEIDGFRRSIRDDVMQTLQSAPVVFAAAAATDKGVCTQFLRTCLRNGEISTAEEVVIKQFVHEHQGIEMATKQCIESCESAKAHLDALPPSEALDLMVEFLNQFPTRVGDVY
eukprot:m.122327 g.122327  ORF g.122327 m.122327 type:complete len:438 (-) comp28913_c0_seq2:75-1388(-)